jgi:hypothetical protein
MTSYSLTVDIDPAQQAILKEGGYNLCVAKNVNGVYNVVWSGGDFLSKNIFTWIEKYQVFATTIFQNGLLTQASTNAVAIAGGQTATLDGNGLFENATGPTSGVTFTCDNEYKAIYFGVNTVASDGTATPIYVDEKPTVTGTDALTPQVDVLVFFDRSLTTGTMFSESVSHTHEVDYGTQNTATILYDKDGNWEDGAGEIFLPQIYSGKHGFTPMEHASVHDGTIPRAIAAKIHARQSAGYIPDIHLISAILTFHSEKAAKEAAIFLSNRGIPNLKLSRPRIGAKKVQFQIGWAEVVFMKFAMKGKDDNEKIENAFKCELGVLRHGPSETKFIPLLAV